MRRVSRSFTARPLGRRYQLVSVVERNSIAAHSRHIHTIHRPSCPLGGPSSGQSPTIPLCFSTTDRNNAFLRPCSFNKYTQIASRAVRQGLKESERVAAEKRAQVGLKVQTWENGVGGEQVSFWCSFWVWKGAGLEDMDIASSGWRGSSVQRRWITREDWDGSTQLFARTQGRLNRDRYSGPLSKRSDVTQYCQSNPHVSSRNHHFLHTDHLAFPRFRNSSFLPLPKAPRPVKPKLNPPHTKAQAVKEKRKKAIQAPSGVHDVIRMLHVTSA